MLDLYQCTAGCELACRIIAGRYHTWYTIITSGVVWPFNIWGCCKDSRRTGAL